MKLEKIESHESELKNRLLIQFKNDPQFNKLYEFYAKDIQRVEDTLFAIWGYTFDNAPAKILELEGSNHHCPRPKIGIAATNDDAYRSLIKATIFVTFSTGTYQDIYKILRALGASKIEAYRIPQPKVLKLQVTGNFIIELDEILKYLIEATAPIQIQIIKFTENYPFGFAGNPKARSFGVGKLASVQRTEN